MKLSIITINRNNAAGLEKTLKSVADQTFTGFEYIVIDGASTDDSVDIIKKYADKITWWVSESDTGIYNAMNKGIRKANGDYCLFLNSWDWLVDVNTLEKAFEEITGLETADIYYSDRIGTDGFIFKAAVKYDVNILIDGGPSHQNSLIKTELFYKHGFYNEKLKIVSDYEFFLREGWIYHSKFTYIKMPIAIVDTGGISHIERNLTQKERSMVLNDIFGELSQSLMELRDYRRSVYADILTNWGNSKLLNFVLKTYRYIIKRIKKCPCQKII